MPKATDEEYAMYETHNKKFVLATIFMLVVGVACVFFAVYSSNAHGESKVKIPTNFAGQWRQSNSTNDSRMNATITAGSIQINLTTPEADSIYWLGTFDSYRSTKSSFTTISNGDPDAMALSIFGSQDKTKEFKYKDGVITYKFTIMGETSTVRLVKTIVPAATPSTYHAPGYIVPSKSSKQSTVKPPKVSAPKINPPKIVKSK